MKIVSTFFSLLLTPLVAVMPLHAELGAAGPGATTPSSTTPASPANSLQIHLAGTGKAVVEANSSLGGYAIAVTDAAGMPVADVAVALRLPEDGATGFFVDGAHSAVAYTNAEGVAKFPQVNWGSALGSAAIRVTAAKGELHAGAIIEQAIIAHSISAAQTGSAPPGLAAWDAEANGPQADPPASAGTAKAASPAQPGTPASVAAVQSGATPGPTGTAPEPVVSIVNSASTGASRGGSNKKWLILAAVGAAAGVGIALALAGKGAAAATAPSTGLSIGAPSISVGH